MCLLLSLESIMTSLNSPPKTPLTEKVLQCDDSGSKSPAPGCSSTPSSKFENSPLHKGFASRRRLLQDESPPKKRAKYGCSPVSHCSNSSGVLSVRKPSKSLRSDLTNHAADRNNETLSVNIEFPLGGWDENTSEESSCGLEIVESEAEVQSPPIVKVRKNSEICEEDNAILSGMGEEIERQLEAKAARNRLTVPNVKNILRSVITNPLVLDMVRKSIKNGNVSVSGDFGDFVYEPRITRAKAKQLLGSVPEMPWGSTSQKVSPTSVCHALINENLDDSEDDEEYKPFEDEPSDNDYSERDGSERGSERDISMEQSPACFDADTESNPPTPSPRPNIMDSATQTNWSEDGVFKVPQAPVESHPDHIKEENIALRTRSKLPLNDTPLEEIEQAFIPPDITPDLYDTTCDNADWQEFLTEFMQPMRSEAHAHDDEEEDPEYNVLADEEIIDKEELRMDKGVKVSKKELKELMKELMEFSENMSSDDDEKGMTKNWCTSDLNPFESQALNNSPVLLNDDFSFLEACMSMGSFTPTQGSKTTPQSTPSCCSGLNTPVPAISPPIPRASGSGKKTLESSFPSAGKDRNPFLSPIVLEVCSPKGQMPTPGKKENGGDALIECPQLQNDNEPDFSPERTWSSPNKNIRNSSGKESFHLSPEAESKVSKGSIGKKPSTESPPTSEENTSFVPALHVSYSGTISAVQSDSFKTPLKLEIQTECLAESETLESSSLLRVSKCSELSPLDDHCLEFETLSITTAQRLLLDQQMRQHVQLLTQHYLQCYQHPLYDEHAASCKELLFTLKFLGGSKPRSSFRAANLAAALQTIHEYESEDAEEIKSFWEKEMEEARFLKSIRRKYVGDFPLQLKSAFANSLSLVYPDLLPPHPFIMYDCAKWPMMTSEVMLLGHGFSQFYPYVKETYPKEPKRWRRLTLALIAEHIMTCKTEKEVYCMYRHASRKYKGNPVEHFMKYKKVPKTVHYVVPFDEQKMKPMKLLCHNVLPRLWRDYIYPARE